MMIEDPYGMYSNFVWLKLIGQSHTHTNAIQSAMCQVPSSDISCVYRIHGSSRSRCDSDRRKTAKNKYYQKWNGYNEIMTRNRYYLPTGICISIVRCMHKHIHHSCERKAQHRHTHLQWRRPHILFVCLALRRHVEGTDSSSLVRCVYW